MAYSYTTYTGDGSTTDYAVVFPYLDTDHVNLTVDGVSVSFSWVNSGTVRAAVAPANATVVRVSRSTSRGARIKSYADLQMLNMEDMNADALQLFYVAQEAFDAVAEAPSGGDMRAVNNLSEVSPSAARNNIGALASANPVITGVLTLDDAPTDPLHATTKAYVDALVAAIPPGTGETNTMASVGAGVSVYKDKSGVQLRLKSLVAGTGVLLTAGADTIQIDATGVGGGEVNVGQSVAVTGEQLYAGKSGVALQFKGIANGTGITKTVTAGDVALAVDLAAAFAWTNQHAIDKTATDNPAGAALRVWSANNGAPSSGGVLVATGYRTAQDIWKTTNIASEAAAGNSAGGIHALYVQHKVSGVMGASGRLVGGIRVAVENDATGVASEATAVYAACRSAANNANGTWGYFADVYHDSANAGSKTRGSGMEVIRRVSSGWVAAFEAKSMNASTHAIDAAFIVSNQSASAAAFGAGFTVGDFSHGAEVGIAFDCAYGTVNSAALRAPSGVPVRMSGTDSYPRDMVWNSSSNRMEFQYNGTNTFDIPIHTGTTKTYAFGMRTTAAANFTKTNPTDGAASPKNPVTYIRVQVDGANYRLALYND